jgi:Zn-dependent alcohol dehydrogenase
VASTTTACGESRLLGRAERRQGRLTTYPTFWESAEGESVPDIFIPQLIELNAQGRFPFEKLVRFYSLDQINQAAQDSENGTTIKPVIRLSAA